MDHMSKIIAFFVFAEMARSFLPPSKWSTLLWIVPISVFAPQKVCGKEKQPKILSYKRLLSFFCSLNFQISHWRFPECSLRDKFLHFFFIVNVCLMIACAAVTIICFKEVEPVREPIVNRQPHIDLFFQVSIRTLFNRPWQTRSKRMFRKYFSFNWNSQYPRQLISASDQSKSS